MGLQVLGHSGYAEEGSDVVCAAVSVLVQTLAIGLVEVLHLPLWQQVDQEKALIELRWGDQGGEERRVLVETILRALKETASSYSGYLTYLEVSEHAV